MIFTWGVRSKSDVVGMVSGVRASSLVKGPSRGVSSSTLRCNPKAEKELLSSLQIGATASFNPELNARVNGGAEVPPFISGYCTDRNSLNEYEMPIY